MNRTIEERGFLARFWPVMLWACAIIVISSIPHLTVPETRIRNLDKMAHVLEFAIFGLLLAWAMAAPGMRLGAQRTLLIVLVGVLLAVIDESSQSLVPGRKRNPFDGLADVVGIVVALVLWHVIAWVRSLCRARPS